KKNKKKKKKKKKKKGFRLTSRLSPLPCRQLGQQIIDKGVNKACLHGNEISTDQYVSHNEIESNVMNYIENGLQYCRLNHINFVIPGNGKSTLMRHVFRKLISERPPKKNSPFVYDYLYLDLQCLDIQDMPEVRKHLSQKFKRSPVEKIFEKNWGIQINLADMKLSNPYDEWDVLRGSLEYAIAKQTKPSLLKGLQMKIKTQLSELMSLFRSTTDEETTQKRDSDDYHHLVLVVDHLDNLLLDRGAFEKLHRTLGRLLERQQLTIVAFGDDASMLCYNALNYGSQINICVKTNKDMVFHGNELFFSTEQIMELLQKKVQLDGSLKGQISNEQLKKIAQDTFEHTNGHCKLTCDWINSSLWMAEYQHQKQKQNGNWDMWFENWYENTYMQQYIAANMYKFLVSNTCHRFLSEFGAPGIFQVIHKYELGDHVKFVKKWIQYAEEAKDKNQGKIFSDGMQWYVKLFADDNESNAHISLLSTYGNIVVPLQYQHFYSQSIPFVVNDMKKYWKNKPNDYIEQKLTQGLTSILN
ncbi:hypothetical protein RFI_24321, partial [Reticulomyxa filosa]